MRLLDEIFLEFDDLVKQAVGALKIETIAGVYLVAANGAGTFSHLDRPPAVERGTRAHIADNIRTLFPLCLRYQWPTEGPSTNT